MTAPVTVTGWPSLMKLIADTHKKPCCCKGRKR